MAEGRLARRLVSAGKVAVTVVLLWWILRRIDWGHLTERLMDLDEGRVALAFLAFLGISVLEVLRMRTVLSVFTLGWRDLVRIHFIGIFVGSFLPGQMGADLYKVYFLGRLDDSPDRGLALVGLIRLTGLLLLSAAAGLGLLLQGDALLSHLEPNPTRVAAALLIMGATLAAVLTLPSLRNRIRRFLRRARSSWLELDRSQLTGLFLFSLGVVVARLLMVDALTAATGMDLSWDRDLVVVSLASLVSLVPISIGGLGVREGTVTATLVLFEVPYESAILVALLWRVFMVSAACLGGLLAPRHLDRLSLEQDMPASH